MLLILSLLVWSCYSHSFFLYCAFCHSLESKLAEGHSAWQSSPDVLHRAESQILPKISAVLHCAHSYGLVAQSEWITSPLSQKEKDVWLVHFLSRMLKIPGQLETDKAGSRVSIGALANMIDIHTTLQLQCINTKMFNTLVRLHKCCWSCHCLHGLIQAQGKPKFFIRGL